VGERSVAKLGKLWGKGNWMSNLGRCRTK
jgi:hypothetical protein